MLGSLTLILLCQLVGEVITRMTNLPVPGPVIGMIILFCGMLISPQRMPDEIETVGGFLLRYLPLLFVPAGVGVVTHLDLLIRSWAPLAGAIVIGTLVTIALTGVAMRFFNRRCSAVAKESSQ